MTAQHPGAVDQPIQDFSDCHVGIVSMLDELASLARPLSPAMQRSVAAGRVLAFFQDVVSAHHLEEERELFSAVMADATQGPELRQVQELVNRLVDEHRRLEALFAQRIGLETMDTPAACRTYNILAGEGRKVLAAIVLEQSEPSITP